MHLTVTPQVLNVVFSVEYAAGQSWEVAVDESWRRNGSGNSTFNQAFDPGSHTAILRAGGSTLQTVNFMVLPTQYTPTPIPPTPTPTPPPPDFPHIENPPIPPEPVGLAPGGYWYVGEASPNDSTSKFVGSKFGSRADCIRMWQSFGNSGDGRCTYVAPPAPAPDTSLANWQKTVNDTISKGYLDLTEWMQSALTGLQEALTGLQKTVQDESAAWRAAVDGIWNKLEDWLVERILVILEKALDIEVKK